MALSSKSNFQVTVKHSNLYNQRERGEKKNWQTRTLKPFVVVDIGTVNLRLSYKFYEMKQIRNYSNISILSFLLHSGPRILSIEEKDKLLSEKSCL